MTTEEDSMEPTTGDVDNGGLQNRQLAVSSSFTNMTTSAGPEDSAVLFTQTQSAFLSAVLTLACLFTLVAGIVILTTVGLTPRLRRLSAAFLISLIGSDVLVGAVVMPWPLAAVIIQTTGRPYEQSGCAVLGFFNSLFLRSSVLSLASIAVDRYQAIINCLQYSTHAGLVYVMRGLVAIWLPAILSSLPPLLGWGQYHYHQGSFMCTVDWQASPSFTVFVFCMCYLMPLLVMIYCYTRIIRIARQHVRRILSINTQVMGPDQERARVDPTGVLAYAVVDPIKRLSLFPVEGAFSSHHGSLSDTIMYLPNNVPNPADMDTDNISSASNTSNMGVNLRKESRATIRLLGLVLVFITFWTPYYAVALRLAHRIPTGPLAVTLTTWMTLIGSCINPIIYALASKRFRHAIKRLCIKSKRKKQNPRRDNLEKKHRNVVTQIASLYTKGSKSMSSSDQRGFRVSSMTNGTLVDNSDHTPTVKITPVQQQSQTCWQHETSPAVIQPRDTEREYQNANNKHEIITTETVEEARNTDGNVPGKLAKQSSLHFEEIAMKPNRLPPLLRKHLMRKKQSSISSESGEVPVVGPSISITLGSSKPPLPELPRGRHSDIDTSGC